MTYADTLTALDAFGILLRRNGPDKLFLAGPTNRLPPEVIEAARGHKLRLLRALPEGGAEVNPITLMPGVPTFVYVTKPDQLPQVIDAVSASKLVALDTETFSTDPADKQGALHPRSARVRLLQLAPDAAKVYVIDCLAVDPAPLWGPLRAKRLVAHNAAFDLANLANLGFVPGEVECTMVYARLLYATGTAQPEDAAALENVLFRELDLAVDKAEQASDWAAPKLSGTQLAYAATDVSRLADLHRELCHKLAQADMTEVRDLEGDCVPAVAWLARGGILIDRPALEKIVAEDEAKAAQLEPQLCALAPPKPTPDQWPAGAGNPPKKHQPDWNFNSVDQVKALLALLGHPVPNGEKDTLKKVPHPAGPLLAEYRTYKRDGGTFGHDWLAKISPDGRMRPEWQQLGAESGRFSCKQPTLQNIKRGSRVRSCFVAPPGRVLVKCDYSQIELRVAAKVTGDETLTDAFRRGEDVHAFNAKKILGKDEVTKEERQLAKPISFGILYGMGPRSLAATAASDYGTPMTEDQARGYIDAYLNSFPKVKAWYDGVRDANERYNSPYNLRGRGPGETRTLIGRRRLFPRVPDAFRQREAREQEKERQEREARARGEKVRQQGKKKKDDRTRDQKLRAAVAHQAGQRLNTPIQGSAGDALKMALRDLYARRHEHPDAFLVLSVHDELVVECDEANAAAVAEWLRAIMIDAAAPMLAPVPVDADASIGHDWGNTIPVEKWKAGERPEKPAVPPPPPPEPAAAAPAAPATTGRKPDAYKPVKPVIKWHGSKASLAKRIIALMPPHERYVEPFAGSAAVLLARPPAPAEVLADLNADLVNLYRAIKDPDALQRFLDIARAIDLGAGPPPSPGEPDPVRLAFNDALAALAGEVDPVRRAVAFFARCRLSMSGRGKNVAPPPQERQVAPGDGRKTIQLADGPGPIPRGERAPPPRPAVARRRPGDHPPPRRAGHAVLPRPSL
jgi:DNA polymerase-1